MKCQLLTVCLVSCLVGAGRAESAPVAEPPVPPPMPPKVQRTDLEARRQALEANLEALDAEIQRLAAETQAQAQRSDPEGRLTPDQLFELLQAREQRLAEQRFDPAPVVISICLFGCTLTGFLAWLFASYRKSRQLHETIRLMVEKGAEIPEGLLAPPRRKSSDLRRGIILSTAGLGLAIFLAALPDTQGAWGAGVTLLLIGVGHLLVWRLQTGKGTLSSALSPEPQP